MAVHVDKWGENLGGFSPCAFLANFVRKVLSEELVRFAYLSYRLGMPITGTRRQPVHSYSGVLMMQPQALCYQQKFQLLEMLYMRQPNGERVRPGTKAVLWLLADCRAALHWSNARIAEHLGYSLRTIARAMVELREAGILSCFRKRRETAQKYLDVSKAVDLVSTARRIAKQNCAIALSAIRRGLEVPRVALSDHWVFLKGKTMGGERDLKLPEVAQKSDATKQLLEAMREKDAKQPRLFGQSVSRLPKPAEVSDLTPQLRRIMLGK